MTKLAKERNMQNEGCRERFTPGGTPGGRVFVGESGTRQCVDVLSAKDH